MAVWRGAAFAIHRLLNSTRFGNHAPATIRSEAFCNSRRLPLVFSIPRCYTTEEPRTVEIDLSNEESKRRLVNRLLYRSKQRGFLELDLVLGKWVEEHIHSMDENGIKFLIQVLDLENPDLWKWLTAQESPPEAVSMNPVFCAVHKKIMDNLNGHAVPETRTTPGQPWVRGWDDFNGRLDSRISGNQ
ncbi:hypothetical protein Nepgr_025331 [Nepenthes gracilis]|uniref:Succinate dehydrogenase assembly factor 2, mitochondrial n=1 Tax=Nepenthes gracilis TaxID=150966 RepID=A0AAD3XZK6_NEPGR|nr:hypothetical protein Nepgr_025331 [Nepenthes gracilis]